MDEWLINTSLFEYDKEFVHKQSCHCEELRIYGATWQSKKVDKND